MINRIGGYNPNSRWDSYNYNNEVLNRENGIKQSITNIDGKPITSLKGGYGADNIWTAELGGKSFVNVDPNKNLYPQKTPEDNKMLDQQIWNYFKKSAEILGIAPKRVTEVEKLTQSINNDNRPDNGKRFNYKA